jgi:hypothetical protein
MTEFGISPEELAGISSTWRDQAYIITRTDWSSFAQASWSGCDVLAATRACAEPAEQATASIGTRFTVLAQKLDTFSADAVAQDGAMGAEIDELPQR